MRVPRVARRTGWLCERLEALARERGIHTLFLLTTTAAPYFERFGFRRTTRDAIPSDVRASAELQGACPESAVVMERRLPLGPPVS